MKKPASFLLLLSGSLLIGSFLSANPALLVDAAQVGEGLPTAWTAATLDDEGHALETDKLYARAYLDDVKGNALMLHREMTAGSLIVSSDSFPASPNASYDVSFFARATALDDPDNALTVSIEETDTSGGIKRTAVATLEGRSNGWIEKTGRYFASETAASLRIVLQTVGVGDYYVADINVYEGKAFLPIFGLNYAMKPENETQTGLSFLSMSNLSTDAYEGKYSLSLSNSGAAFEWPYLNRFGEDFTLSFRYKHSSQDGARLSLRIDGINKTDGARFWYADSSGVVGDTGGSWSTYSYSFKSIGGQAETNYLELYAYGDWLIDNISITDTAGTEYVIGGTFEALDPGKMTLVGNWGYVDCHNGTYALGGVKNGTHSTGAIDGYIQINEADIGMEVGKDYTVSYEYMGGDDDIGAIFDGIYILGGQPRKDTWTTASCTATGKEGGVIKIYTSNVNNTPAYFRNIKVVDGEGKNLLPALKAPSEEVEKQQVFPYGQMDYEFPEEPTSSSSSSSEEPDPASSESSPDKPSSSSSEPTVESSSSSITSPEAPQENGDSGLPTWGVVLIVIGGILVLGGLGFGITYLARKKHVK